MTTKLTRLYSLVCNQCYTLNISDKLSLKEKNLNLRILTLIFLITLVSCQQNTPCDKDISILKDKADSIATLSQNVLLQNVVGAIQKGGTEYAVDFCQVEAIPITDSLSKEVQMYIQRITDKNRNPKNNFKTKTDGSVFDEFKRKTKLSDTLLIEKEKYVYYKRINIAMPTCLKCHGNLQADIEEKTLQKINTFYPNDKAIGYRLNDFRGLWKIEINK